MLGVLAAAFLVAPPTFADVVNVNDLIKLQPTDNTGAQYARAQGGGPFRVDLPGTVNDFVSFCLEKNESSAFDEDLRVVDISNEARAGGFGGIVGTGDPISATTAFLYTMFRSGATGYTDGFTMQHAIWLLEDEDTSAFSPSVTAMIALATSDMLAAGWGPNNIGDIQVLNLVHAEKQLPNQDVLVVIPPGPNPQVPVPEPTSLVLLGSGLAMAGNRIRRSWKRGP
jgi:hypothetical protein